MVLTGKLSTELGIKSPGPKFFNLFAKELHDVQNHCERVHGAKLHEGDHWHGPASIKHWTYVIDGKVHKCLEKVEDVDEKNQKINYKLFGEDIDQHYKVFKLNLEVIDNEVIDNKGTGHDAVKWTIEYEKLNEDIDPPNAYMDYLSKCTKDIDTNLLKA